jgi:hypothetical protein
MQKLILNHRSLIVVISLALLLRLIAVAVLPSAKSIADDSPWYLLRGERLVTNTITPQEYVTFAPLYALVAGSADHFLGQDGAILFLRLMQAVLGALTAGFVWRIAFRLTSDLRVATVAGLGMALNPIAILDGSMVATEPLVIFI